MKLIVHAPNIQTGGGRSLLLSLMERLNNSMTGCLLLDNRLRFDLPVPDSFIIHQVLPSISGRLAAERRLKTLADPGDKVLCFGNLPPLFRIKGHVSVFIQNRYLVDNIPLVGFGAGTRLRIVAERLWLRFRRDNADKYIVQTTSIQRAVEKKLSVPSVVRPFTPYNQPRQSSRENQNRYDFIYVASGEPHKNHHHLIRAWIHLAHEGIRPSLALTLNEKKFGQLCDWIARVTHDYRLGVTNLGELKRTDIVSLYPNCRALIYPSLLETIGLPLIEARAAGIAIVAAELDYVRDVLDPDYSFDPRSDVSIARAVKRSLGMAEKPLPLMDARSFLDHLLHGN
jgi:glycosyltransferase involved in cell wall biosynthesis